MNGAALEDHGKAGRERAFDDIDAAVVSCRRCPRLVSWREEVAVTKRRAYRGEEYWGRPVPLFGDRNAWLLIVGLAPGAHGANRTGRMFTGDRSGDFLYAALHRKGLASQPQSVARDDGLQLRGCAITAPCRCVPPQNKPAGDELRNCAPYLTAELELLAPGLTAILALGRIAWEALLRHYDLQRPRDWPTFGHGAIAGAPYPIPIVGSFHVSQQNTQTGKLTPAMFDEVLEICAGLRGQT